MFEAQSIQKKIRQNLTKIILTKKKFNRKSLNIKNIFSSKRNFEGKIFLRKTIINVIFEFMKILEQNCLLIKFLVLNLSSN